MHTDTNSPQDTPDLDRHGLDSTSSHRRSLLVLAAIAGATVLAVGLWLTQPWLLFVDVVADESLPLVRDTIESGGGVGSAIDTPARGVEQETSEADRDADARQASGLDESPEPPAASDDDGTGAVESAGPEVLSRGEFVSRDHPTAGAVAIVRLEDGSHVLTIEGLDTDNGPDLFVYLDDDPADAPEGAFDDGYSLGRLRANQGDLVYEIPADVDLTSLSSVAIWCDRFSSLFGAADLTAVG